MQMCPMQPQGRQEWQIQKEQKWKWERREAAAVLALRMEGDIKARSQPGEAGKVKEMTSCLEIPEGIQAC